MKKNAVIEFSEQLLTLLKARGIKRALEFNFL